MPTSPHTHTHTHSLVHHSNYLRYFERAREHVLDPRFLVKLFEDTGRSFVVVSANTKYKVGARHGDILEVRTRACATSSYRLKFLQNVYRVSEEEEEVLLVEGVVEMVCVDKSMRLTKLPETLNAMISKNEKPKRSSFPVGSKKKEIIENTSHDMKCYLDDTDFTGVCYYANYLKWMERARAEILSTEFLSKMRRQDDGVGAAIHEASLNFKSGARFGDRIRITTRTEFQSKFRVLFHHTIYRIIDEKKGIEISSEEDKLEHLVSGKISIICLDKGGSGKLVAFPDSFRDKILDNSRCLK